MRSLLVALTLMGLGGCTASDAVAPVPAADLLRQVPTSISLQGQALVLLPSLWRDFQPIAPPDGQPLVAVLQVAASNGAPLVGTFRVDAAWVVHGVDVWAARVGEERLATPTPVFYQVVARGGPKWGPGIAVDVVVRIRDATGAVQLLRAADAQIQRTD